MLSAISGVSSASQLYADMGRMRGRTSASGPVIDEVYGLETLQNLNKKKLTDTTVPAASFVTPLTPASADVSITGSKQVNDLKKTEATKPLGVSSRDYYEINQLTCFSNLISMLNDNKSNSWIYDDSLTPGFFTNQESYDLFQAFNDYALGKYNTLSTSLDLEDVYTEYLEVGDLDMKKVAAEVTKGCATDDQRMYAIIEYVMNTLTYQTDEQTYGQGEYWSMPENTLKKDVGDCEDGAFLVASLGLNAGVDSGRLRVYGGLARDGYGGAGGHAWAAYRRGSDNQWVTLDWCYYANDLKISDRPLMKEDDNYLYPYFYVTSRGTWVADGVTDTIKNPNYPYPGAGGKQYILNSYDPLPTGNRVNVAA